MSRYLIRRIEDNPAIVLRTHTQIVALEGNGHLERVRWRDDRAGDAEMGCDEGSAMDFDARLDTDDDVDEALKETFPASDPPANTVETGVRVEVESPHVSEFVVRDHREANRFEVVRDGQVAFLQYER